MLTHAHSYQNLRQLLISFFRQNKNVSNKRLNVKTVFFCILYQGNGVSTSLTPFITLQGRCMYRCGAIVRPRKVRHYVEFFFLIEAKLVKMHDNW